MNRRGFVGAALAGVGGLFFPQKLKANSSESFKFGDCVDLEVPTEWRHGKGRREATKSATCKGYIIYVDKDCMQIQCMEWNYSLYRINSTWFLNGQDACKISRRGE